MSHALMMKNLREVTPPKGKWNLVLFDDYEEPGEQYLVVSTHADEKEAVKALAKYKRRYKSATVYVIGDDGLIK